MRCATMRDRNARALLSAGFALPLAVASASLLAAEIEPPTIHESTDYRDVGGATEAELVASLKAVSASDPLGHHFAGATRWQLRWNFRVESTDGRCRVVSAATELDLQTTLIRWNPPLNAQPALVQRWNAFADAVRKHEAGHRDIAIAAARDVGERAGHVADEADCETLKRNVQKVADATLREYRDKESSYDVTTMHGRTQGATFP